MAQRLNGPTASWHVDDGVAPGEPRFNTAGDVQQPFKPKVGIILYLNQDIVWLYIYSMYLNLSEITLTL